MLRRKNAATHDRSPWPLLAAVALIVVVGLVQQLDRFREQLIVDSARSTAQATASAVREFRTLYTREVVEPLRSQGIAARHDYLRVKGAIPLPATLSLHLASRLAPDGGKVALYSEYPFPWTQRPPLDAFAREAYRAIQQNPERSFEALEPGADGPILRYATADRMRSECVDCHNHHPDSPKVDWAVGDVRGLLEVQVPVSSLSATVTSGLETTVSFFAVSALLCIGLLTFGTRRWRAAQAQLVAAKGAMVQSADTLELRSSRLDAKLAKLEANTAEFVDYALQLREANHELAESAKLEAKLRAASLLMMRDAESLRQQSAQASEAKGRFLANMSHEIRTPMNAIVGLADLLATSRLNPEQLDMIETVRRSGQALLTIINDVLDFSKIEAGKLEIARDPLSIVQCVQDVAALVSHSAEKKGLQFRVQVDPAVPKYVLGDVARIRQILTNLLGNAIKFTREGTVSLTVTPLPQADGTSCIEFQILDTGIGINEQGMARLFSAFEQQDTTIVRDFGGTGLGLSISRQLARLMNGDIEVTSVLGEGSNFRFWAPLPKTNTTTLSTSDGLARAVPTGLKVLVVDDNRVNRRVVGAMLKRLDYETAEAVNGAEALEVATAGDFDLVLMDMQMPIMDGITATAALREQEDHRAPNVVIALTANAMESDRQACAKVGMNGFLSKPLTLDAIHKELARIAPQLERRRDQRATRPLCQDDN